jgi:acyl transferase domain-containing protein
MTKRFAIIGIAFEMPGKCQTWERLWEILEQSEDVFSPLPRSRVSLARPEVRELLADRRMPLLDNVENFDHALFRMSKKEADAISPVQKKNLTISFRAIENARLSIDSIGRRTGVFIADSAEDYLPTVRQDPAKVNAFHNLNVSISTLSGRISQTFDFMGPSVTISTACSSSIYALQSAIWAIASEHCEVAIVSGVNLIYGSLKNLLHSKSGMLSPTGRCHSFKQEADGYARGEAAVALVIKEWSRAVADADEIHAVIDSVYVNHNGQSQSMKQPKVVGEEQCFRAVVERSGFPTDSIGMVEAHGTGTIVGDQVEAEAISRVLKHEVPLTAAKSHFGHAEGVSGLVSIVKTVACLQRGLIAPIYRYTAPPDSYPLNNLVPVVKSLPWVTRERRALVCNYGFSGSNGAVVMSNE